MTQTSNYYTLSIEQYYGKIEIDKIIRKIINGNEKSQSDFIRISYKVLYNVIGGLYREIKCRKDVIQQCKNIFLMEDYNEDDVSIKMISLLILEDISAYLGLNRKYVMECAKNR